MHKLYLANKLTGYHPQAVVSWLADCQCLGNFVILEDMWSGASCPPPPSVISFSISSWKFMIHMQILSSLDFVVRANKMNNHDVSFFFTFFGQTNVVNFAVRIQLLSQWNPMLSVIFLTGIPSSQCIFIFSDLELTCCDAN